MASDGLGERGAGARPPAEASEPRRVGPRAVLHLVSQRNFGPYFVGNALSASGTWFQNLAAALLIYRLTGSELLLGVLNFAQFAPILVLAPWTGSAADRYDRRRLLLATQVAATALAGALAALAWADLADAWVVIAISLAQGVATAFALPAQQALLAALVDERELGTAVALNSMTYNLARALGPAAAALAVEHLGIPAAFALNAASYLVFAAAILIVQPRAQRAAERTASRLRESLALLRREPRLAAYLAIVAVVGFASDPVNTLAPALADAFGRADTVAGYVIGVFGAGAVTAAFVLAGRVRATRRRLALTLGLLGAGIVGVAATPWLPVAFVLLFVAGFGYLASNTAATTRLQLDVDEAQRGRMMALWGIAFLGLRPFASLVDGAVASLAGVRTAAVVLAVPALAVAAALAFSAVVRGRAAAARA